MILSFMAFTERFNRSYLEAGEQGPQINKSFRNATGYRKEMRTSDQLKKQRDDMLRGYNLNHVRLMPLTPTCVARRVGKFIDRLYRQRQMQRYSLNEFYEAGTYAAFFRADTAFRAL